MQDALQWARHHRLCGNATMVPSFNAKLAHSAVQRINRDLVAGDIVELGVWKGGMSCMMAMAQQLASGTHRRIWLFDTFEGMPEPTAQDDRRSRRIWKAVRNGTITQVAGTARDRKWAYSPLSEVQSTMARTGYPPEQLRFVKGKVEDTLRSATNVPQQIALLRLDTDWFESTRAELDVLWPRLAPGGWLYIDDYSSFGGAHKAVDNWLRTEHNLRTRGCRKTRDRLGSLHLWKTRPYDPSRPFEVTNESVWCLQQARAAKG